MTKILAVVSDLHINSAVGLLPPGAKRDDGQAVEQSKSQQWLWRRWLAYWDDVRLASESLAADVSVVINGDWGDLNKHDGFQLLTTNPDTVLDWMIEAMEPLPNRRRLYVVRGTEAHVGGAGWIENRAAKDAGATIDQETKLASFWALRLQVEEARVLFAHHPGTNSRVPWTIGAAANRAAVKTQLAFYNEDDRPHLAVFSHVHHGEDSGDNHAVRAIFTPPWCLADAYSFRLGYGWATQEVGGLIVVVDGDRFRVIKRYSALPVGGKRWTIA